MTEMSPTDNKRCDYGLKKKMVVRLVLTTVWDRWVNKI